MLSKRRTRAARSSRTADTIMRLAVEGAPAGVTVVDTAGTILMSNRRAEEMGISTAQGLHPEVLPKALEVFSTQTALTHSFTVEAQRPGMRTMSVQVVVKPLHKYVVIYTTDESESVRMESARRDFVANVSHELKTPVGGMALLSEALIESADDPETVQYFGERINKEAHRMADMINELIALSKLQGAASLPALKAVAVDEVIDEAMSRNQVAADHAGIALSRTAPIHATVLGDFSLLCTAIANLISNAINYSPAATPVVVDAAIVDVNSPGVVQISVIDQGIGIADKHQQRVFERFFRVDKARSRNTGGTGLGLAIVKHVAANHGGRITVDSAIGKGSTFTLELPLHAGAPQQ